MKVLIVDDHPLFLVGLRHIFEDVAGEIELLEATDFERAFALIDQHSDIDWICLDLQLPSGSGFDFLNQLANRGAKIPVAILSAEEEPAIVERALAAGAVGYLSKSATKQALTEGIESIAKGDMFISSVLLERLEEYRAHHKDHKNSPLKLTRRQKEILALLSAGLSNQDIANQLHLAESTVKGHVSALFDLLGVGNRAACTNRALTLHLLD